MSSVRCALRSSTEFSSKRSRGGHLPLGEYRWAFDKACNAVGIEGLVPQGSDLPRHRSPSRSANVKVVQRLLGHATAAMTLDRYGHLLNDDLAGVARTAVSLRYPEPDSDQRAHVKAL